VASSIDHAVVQIRRRRHLDDSPLAFPHRLVGDRSTNAYSEVLAVRYVVPIVAALALIAGLGGLKFRQISMLMDYGKAAQKAGPPPEVVSSATAEEQSWEAIIPAVGTVAAVKGVTVSNDAPGVVSAILVESGAKVTQGQVLVQLDASVERAQLASARARRELASVNVGRSRALARDAVISVAQLDNDEAVVRSSGADVSAVEAQINRKVVRAPFTGRLGIRSINLGQYLNPGTPIVTLEAIDSVYVDFTLPQQRLADVPPGTPVRVRTDAPEKKGIDGTIVAADPAVDSVTRSIKLRAGVPNKDEALRPGMFVRVSVVLPERKPVLAIPATALLHASYGDSVFVLENKADAPPGPNGKPVKSARQQFVRVSESRGDFVAIEDGIKKGDEIVVAGAFKLRNGASVVVNNDVSLDPKLAPQPENR
jgi:membrane fusion protein (multidrug efflux system)